MPNADRVQKQLRQLERVASSQKAKELLELVNVQRDKTLPAVVDLLSWAVVEGPKLGLAEEAALGERVLEDAAYLAMMGNPAAAHSLIMGEEEPDELPAELANAETPKEAALAILRQAAEALEG